MLKTYARLNHTHWILDRTGAEELSAPEREITTRHITENDGSDLRGQFVWDRSSKKYGDFCKVSVSYWM